MATSVEPFVVVNSSDRRFVGWAETTVPLHWAESLSAFWRYQGDPSRLQPAFVGGAIGLDARRVYVLLEEGSPAASELKCELVTEGTDAVPALLERARPRPEPVPLVRIQERGQEEVLWSSDQTTTEGPLSVRRVSGRQGSWVYAQIAWRFADEPWTRFEVSKVFSDPTTQALQQEAEETFVGHEDAYVHLYGPTLDPLATKLQAGPFGWARRVWQKDTFGNGQGPTAARGVLLQYLHARPGKEEQDLLSMEALQRGDVRACAAAWEGSAGPFRAVPALSPYLGDGRDAALARYQNWKAAVMDRPIRPWEATTMGLLPNAGSTGAQDDFPQGPAPEVLSPATVAPYNLAELEAAGYGEFRRPIHYRNLDGSRLVPKEHPNWRSWSQQTHFHPTVSPDRLGKPDWWGPFETHSYGGRDNQHFSLNRLGAAVLLGGSRLLEDELNDHIVHWLQHSFDGTNRARGRHMNGAVWLYRLTRNEDLLAAMKAEAEPNVATWPSTGGQGQPWPIDCSSWGTPDGRVLGGRTPFWVGWSESLCAPGLWLGHKETGVDAFRDLAIRSLRTLMLWGWFKRDGLPGWRLASGVTYRGFRWDPSASVWVPDGTQGQPLPLEAYQDPLQVEDSGGGFELWAYPAVKVAQLLIDEPAVQVRCKDIIEQIRGMRGQTKTFDDMDRWLAVA